MRGFNSSTVMRGRRAGAICTLALASTLAVLCPATAAAPTGAQVEERHTPPPVNEDMILRDPASPVSGNPQGDVTIVAFFDYNCPYCKKTDPVIERLSKKDGKIRIVYKDLPILAESSVYGAHLALGAKYQGKYAQARQALMAIPGGHSDVATMRRAVSRAGVDMKRLDRDLKAHASEINAYLLRNLDHARALGLQGVPVYLIGPFKVAAALDEAGYAEVVEDARARAQ